MNDRIKSPWIDEEQVKEIKRTVTLESVLAHYGLLEGLTRKGNRLSGRSPFREDRSPSFSCDVQKGLWNDFGGRPEIDGQIVSGDIFGLVQAIKRCGFRDAVLELHSWASHSTPVQAAAAGRQKVNSALAETDPAGHDADPPLHHPTENIPFGRELKGRTHIPPLLERGLTEETIRKFGVVYCTSGLMKGRIAFPIKNAAGEIMAYAGRAVKKEDEEKNGKYRFPPNFNKSLEIYNIERIANDAETKKAVKDYGLIVVEGFTDVMKLDQEGFPNVVGLMGSDFHEAQKAMLLDPRINPTRRLTLFLDNDEAGERGKRAIANAVKYDGFFRYVDWGMTPEEKTEPEHFDKAELATLLGFKK